MDPYRVCLCLTVLSIPCSLVVTCWEKAGLMALRYIVFSCVIVLWYPGFCVVLDCIDS